MRPPHKICRLCGHESLFGEGAEKHLQKAHGFLTVQVSTGGIKYVPILSHPAHNNIKESN